MCTPRFPIRSIALLAALISWAVPASCAPPAVGAERPNILFVLADDMGWQDTSVAFGPARTPWNERYHTPALERLAREGMRFTQAYSCAVCTPTRVSLMTGQNVARHGVTNWTHLSGDEPSTDRPHPRLLPAPWNWNGLQPVAGIAHSVPAPTLPALLKQAGYHTLQFGKGHLGAERTPGADPQVFGFDIRIGGRSNGGNASYSGLSWFGAKSMPSGPWRAYDLDAYFGQDIHLTEALTIEASRAIRDAAATRQPFFCYFAHYAPHTPIEPDERFAPDYRAAGLDDTEAAYASLIEGMDRSVGELLALLDELGIADQTLVVFTSDNGGVSHAYRSMAGPHTHNSPLSSGKGSHREGGIRVPLLVRWEGVTPAATTRDVPVRIEDWFTTLLHVAGTDVPANIDGVDLTSVIEGQAERLPDRPLVWHFPNFWGPLSAPGPVAGPGMGPSSTLRDGDWKLIYYHDGPRFELFNLAEDLSETHNLVDEEPERVRAMAARLTELLQERHAVMPRQKNTGEPVAWPAEAASPSDGQERRDSRSSAVDS